MFEHHKDLIAQTNPLRIIGKVSAVTGLTVQAEGFPAAIGSMCRICPARQDQIVAQVVGFKGQAAVLMPLKEVHGIAKADRVFSEPSMERVGVGPALLGRVVNGLGEPIDRGGRLHAEQFYHVYAEPPAALSRKAITKSLGTGIRALDAMMTLGTGQRMGIFSGAGIGKSVLLGMISRYTAADVTVVALVGERGREVKDFVTKDLGEDGLRRTVLVVSTSDESPVLRVRACFVATAIAEYFRDQGKHVLLLMDSLTRLAMAQRQIGLAAGEPPATKGYTPSVFSLLPRLLERAGNTDKGSITAFYSVLVEGDDVNEPISDAVRGILDGHLLLSRALASKGHYPAVDVMGSISRLMIDVVDEQHYQAAQLVRRVLGAWFEIEDLVNIGAYASGSNPEFDLAIQVKPDIDRFLQQGMREPADLDDVRRDLMDLAKAIKSVQEKSADQRAQTALAS